MDNIKQFGVHKIWFFYTDDAWVTEDKIATCAGEFDNLEEANEALKKLERTTLRGFDELTWDFWTFWEDRRKEFNQEMLDFSNKYGLEHLIFMSSKGLQIHITNEITDEQIDEILSITKIHFHRVVEYDGVENLYYAQFRQNFWGRKNINIIKKDNSLISNTIYLDLPDGAYDKSITSSFLINKSESQVSTKFNNFDKCFEDALSVTIEYLTKFPSVATDMLSSFASPMQKAYLKQCSSFTLETITVTHENIESLKEYNANVEIGNIMNSTELNLDSPTIKEDLKGFLALLENKPFEIHNIRKVSLKNGEKIRSAISDHEYF